MPSQAPTNNDKIKKILKAAFYNYLLVGAFVTFSILLYWEYQTKGFITTRYHISYGKDAETIVWLTIFSTITMFFYCTFLTIKNLNNKASRDQYYKDIIGSNPLICADCLEVNDIQIKDEFICLQCGSNNIEILSGFFERHPEKKEFEPTIKVPPVTIKKSAKLNIALPVTGKDAISLNGVFLYAILLVLAGPALIAYVLITYFF